MFLVVMLTVTSDHFRTTNLDQHKPTQKDNNTFFAEYNKLLLQMQQMNDSSTYMFNAAYR